ncbi:hypothetical protein DFA_10943 [Cavenderia fasciculata]|uniref:WD40 repeat-containing protein n=1 Tax=Cavenderia fasciculata TaxID=261658 RepID=F4QBU7_CACFS|nr:uncharacterized protein DFA_10943 [Cavenderia fasciculata]EGG14685.1 hypothetical protein DFA_10943 [Cavenderia fasciculata]|eukprot:XP_004351193.1 hypothetical protein DFA_10943 [Cavenderia fasciculata]
MTKRESMKRKIPELNFDEFENKSLEQCIEFLSKIDRCLWTFWKGEVEESALDVIDVSKINVSKEGVIIKNASPQSTTPLTSNYSPNLAPSKPTKVLKLKQWAPLRIQAPSICQPYDLSGRPNTFSPQVLQSSLLKEPHSHIKSLDPIPDGKVMELAYLNQSIAYIQQVIGLSKGTTTLPIGEYSTHNIGELLHSTKALPKSIQSCLDRQSNHNIFFTNNGSIELRPYLPFLTRRHFFPNSVYTTKPNHFLNILPSPNDTYHVPFSQLEINILLQHLPNLVSGQVPKIQQLYHLCKNQLYGRVPIDVYRYLEDIRLGLEEFIPTNPNQTIVYTPKKEKFSTEMCLYKQSFGISKPRSSNKKIIGSLIDDMSFTHSYSPSGHPVIDVKIDPTGKTNKILALSTDKPNEATLYDFLTNETIKLEHHGTLCPEGHFSIDGNEVLTCGSDGSMVVWDVHDGKKLFSHGLPNDHALRIAIHPEMTLAATGYKDSKSIIMTNYKNYVCVDLTAPQKPEKNWPAEVSDLCFGNGVYNNYLLCGLYNSSDDDENDRKDAFCSLININKPEVYTLFHTAHKEISNVAWNPKSSAEFVVGSTDGYLTTYDIRCLDKPTRSILTGQLDSNLISWSPCGAYLVYCGSGNCPLVYDKRYIDKPLIVLSHDVFDMESGVVSHSTWSKQGNFLITCGDDCCVRVWDISKGDPYVKCFKNHKSQVNFVDISRDSDFIVSGGDDGHVNIYSTRPEGNIFY